MIKKGNKKYTLTSISIKNIYTLTSINDKKVNKKIYIGLY